MDNLEVIQVRSIFYEKFLPQSKWPVLRLRIRPARYLTCSHARQSTLKLSASASLSWCWRVPKTRLTDRVNWSVPLAILPIAAMRALVDLTRHRLASSRRVSSRRKRCFFSPTLHSPLFLFTSLRKPSLIHSTLRVSPSLHASLHFSSAAACICAFVLAGSLECTVCFVWTDTADSLGQLRLSACGISHASPRSFPDKTVGHDIFDNTSQGSASVKWILSRSSVWSNSPESPLIESLILPNKGTHHVS